MDSRRVSEGGTRVAAEWIAQDPKNRKQQSCSLLHESKQPAQINKNHSWEQPFLGQRRV